MLAVLFSKLNEASLSVSLLGRDTVLSRRKRKLVDINEDVVQLEDETSETMPSDDELDTAADDKDIVLDIGIIVLAIWVELPGISDRLVKARVDIEDSRLEMILVDDVDRDALKPERSPFV
jgi:hypothetical protein